MDAIIQAVLLANRHFYRALALADLNLMARMWLASPEAVCVHPGWPPLRGWADIRESWRGIFEQQGLLYVWPTEAVTRVYGLTAEVTCLENIDVGQMEDGSIIRTRAVNVFRRTPMGWKVLEHHAYTLPAYEAQAPAPRHPFSAN